MPRKTSEKRHTAAPPTTFKRPAAKKTASPAAAAPVISLPAPVISVPAQVNSVPAPVADVVAETTAITTVAPVAAPASAPVPATPSAACLALLADLMSTDAEVAREAATGLGGLGESAAVEPLIAVLINADGFFHSVVRAAAASSLAQLRDQRAVAALLDAIRDPMAEASAEAVRALAVLGYPRAVDSMIEVVRNADGFFLPIVRRAAVIALGQLGGDRATAELRDVAGNPMEDFVIREAAEEALR